MSHYHATTVDADQYDAALEQLKPQLDRPLHFLQSSLYGRWQTKAGKQVIYAVATKNQTVTAVAAVVLYPLPGGASYAYAPYGPLATQAEAVESLVTTIMAVLPRHCIFLRIDTNLAQLGTTPPRHVAAMASLQPRREWALDISTDPEHIFTGFYKTARYQVRLAERHDTTVRFEACSREHLDGFFALMEDTGDRNHFGILPKAYYQAVCDELQNRPGCYLAFADVAGVPAAAALLALYDNQVHYIFGGSSNTYRKIAPSYKLLWEAMLRSQKDGATIFNFGGISDEIKNTHLRGVTDFKKRFGGYVVEHELPRDIVMRPLAYRLLSLYKRIR